MANKLKIKKGSVEETCLLPLWGRAYETKRANPRLIDKKAVEIMKQIDYDFSDIIKTQAVSQHGWVARSLHTDKMVKKFIKQHPKTTIVNIGCGMDTTFSRIDNGEILFYELDLPPIIDIRKNFYEDTARHRTISSSFLKTEYFEQIEVRDNLLFLAGGVLMYFTENQIKEFFIKAGNYFKNCNFYFDCLSPQSLKFAKKAVLKKSNMNISLGEGWGLKPVENLEKWDQRFKVISKIPMYKGVKKEMKFIHKIMTMIADITGACYMVHLQIKELN